jgi:ABC-2 type transport system permease protein
MNDMTAALLAMLFGALALAVGTATGGRSVAPGVTALIGVLSYVANTVVPQRGAR